MQALGARAGSREPTWDTARLCIAYPFTPFSTMTAATPAVLALLFLLILPVARKPGVGGGGVLWSHMVLERRQVSHWHPRSILHLPAVAGAFPLHLQQEHRGGQRGERSSQNCNPAMQGGTLQAEGGTHKPPFSSRCRPPALCSAWRCASLLMPRASPVRTSPPRSCHSHSPPCQSPRSWAVAGAGLGCWAGDPARSRRRRAGPRSGAC